MHYPSYNALLRFPLCMFSVWIILGLWTYQPATCFLVSVKLISLRMAIAAPWYVHVSYFTLYSSFKCELVHHWLCIVGALYSTWQCISWRCFGIEHHKSCTVEESDSRPPSEALSSVIAPVGRQCMADRTYTIWMQACDLKRSITLAVSNHIWMLQITKSLIIFCMQCAPPQA